MLGWFSAGECLGFAVESCQAFRVRGHGRGENLDGDLPREVRVRRLIHLPHSAFADPGSNFIRAEAGT